MFKFLLTLAWVSSIAYSGTLSGQNSLTPGVDAYRLLVKFSPDYVWDVDEDKIYFSRLRTISPEKNTFIDSFSYDQAVRYTPQEQEIMRRGETPPPAQNRVDLSFFRGMVYVREAEELTPEEVLDLAEEFEQLSFVEYTALEPVDPPPPPAIESPQNIPDFTWRQFYRKYNHGNDTIGINIDYAWNRGIYGQGVRVADIEWGFDYDHVDLAADNFVELISTTDNSNDDHGTAVAGVMVAHDNGFGVTGMVHEVDTFYGISEIRHGRVTGITEGLRRLRAGDVFLYEMQTGGQGGEFVPADYNQAVWDITQEASDAGVIIVAAAGNGGENLDDPFYNSYNARGDNGAIIVGAGTIQGRNRAGFSTYGSRVNLQGWGDWSVMTTGYGALHNGGPHATYTGSFSGTSSATPIVASAVVAVQSFAKNELDLLLTPQEMRELLIETGTAQGSGWGAENIVPQPNVQAAIEWLENEHGTLPRYTLHATAENGTVDMDPQKSRYDSGSVVTLTAEADEGYTFTEWTGDLSGDESPTTLVVNDNKHVEAHFSYTGEELSLETTMQDRMFATETSHTIQWSSTNIDDSIHLILIHPTGTLDTIETDLSPNQEYEWDIDKKLPTATGYRLSITSANSADTSQKFSLIQTTLAEDMVLIDQETISIESVSSEETHGEQAYATNLLDMSTATRWHTAWLDSSTGEWFDPAPSHPHTIVFDLDTLYGATGFAHTPRLDESTNSLIHEYLLEGSTDGTAWDTISVGAFDWSEKRDIVTVGFPRTPARYIRFTTRSTYEGSNNPGYASGLQMNFFADPSWEDPTPVVHENRPKEGILFSQGTVHLTLDEPVKIHITSVTGRRIAEIASPGTATLNLREKNIPAGVYLFRIMTDAGIIQTQQIRLP
ncbi:S8 family serine peptidase [Chitinivibrio alkaliphilus]|uniref:Serine protease n=1 Tax=Chitinivibrio alkaliphilus ACht1 TaxID=1313304 RepID=U7D7T5_9BACT|nr:S8 family serine peptidase [Chitinivibrio alkaliphilus]ERP39015.1 serine protease [Chitinivibrio alkaliphilus ACht1]